MIILVTFLLVLSIFDYLSFFFFKNSTSFLVIFNLMGILTFFWMMRKSFKTDLFFFKEFFGSLNFILVLLVVLAVAAKAVVISPLVLTKQAPSFTHIQVTPVGDYYKDSFFVLSLAQDGIPPKNPYFPSANLSYYLGYYLVPASLVNIFNLPANWVVFIFTIITDLLSLFLILEVILKVFNGQFFYQLLSLLLVLSGLGVFAIPFVFNTLGQDLSDLGLQLNSIYEALLFVPQHFLPAALSVWTLFKLLRGKISFVSLWIISVFIVLSSVFVSLIYFFWLALLFLFEKKWRWRIFLVCLASLIILIPNFIYLSERSNLFYFYRFAPYHFSNNYFLNVFLSFFTEYGPLLLIFPAVFLFNPKKKWVYVLAILLPLFVTWFVRTPIFNDFSRKTSIPIQFAAAIVFVSCLKVVRSKAVKLVLVVLTLVTILLGMGGAYLEYKHYWQGRGFLDPKDSELIFKVRTLPKNISLASVDRNRWVELIPSLAFKKILSPYLYDSFVYLTGREISEKHGQYESLAVGLFIDPLQAGDLEDLLRDKNSQLKKLNYFFNLYPRDLLIVNNKLWVKKDTNPYLIIFKNMGIKYTNLTSFYTGFNYHDLLSKTRQFLVEVQKNGQGYPVLDHKVSLPEGLQFLASCTDRFPSDLKLEFEDYNLIFNKTAHGQNDRCIGQLFYLDKEDNLSLTKDSNIDNVFSFRVEIR